MSQRLGLGPRQVQRYIAELEEMGLVKRVERFGSHSGKLSNSYDLSGLVERLKALEPEFRQVDDEIAAAMANRNVVAKPSFKPQSKPGKPA